MSEQPSLFETLPENPLPETLTAPDFDRLPNLFEMIDGESRIADDRLGTWASYLRIDLWITRNWHDLSDLGKLVQTVQVSGQRGPRRITTYLNLKQTRYFLNHSRLPHLKPYRTRVMIILDEYEAGNLVSTNAETTIRLQDATEAADQAAPGSTQLGALTERVGQNEKVATEALTVAHQALKLAQAPRMTYPQTPADAARVGQRSKSTPRTYVHPETGEIREIPPLAKPRSS